MSVEIVKVALQAGMHTHSSWSLAGFVVLNAHSPRFPNSLGSVAPAKITLSGGDKLPKHNFKLVDPME